MGSVRQSPPLRTEVERFVRGTTSKGREVTCRKGKGMEKMKGK